MEYPLVIDYFYITLIATIFWGIIIYKTQFGDIIYSHENGMEITTNEKNNQGDVNYTIQIESEFKQ